MIIEPTEKTAASGNKYYEIINDGDPYFACGYTPDKVIRLITPEDSPVESRALASGLNGFGASTYQELLDEIENRNLIWPQE